MRKLRKLNFENHLQIRLAATLDDALTAAADRAGLSRPDFIRQILAAAVGANNE